MLSAKVTTDFINKYRPTIKIQQPKKDKKGNISKRGDGTIIYEEVIVDNCYCKCGDEIRIISKSLYVYKSGCMYIAENKDGERFTIDESYIGKIEKKFSLDDDEDEQENEIIFKPFNLDD